MCTIVLLVSVSNLEKKDYIVKLYFNSVRYNFWLGLTQKFVRYSVLFGFLFPSGWIPDDVRELDRDSRCEFSQLQVVAPGSWHGVRDQSLTDKTGRGWDGQSRTTAHHSDQMCRWGVKNMAKHKCMVEKSGKKNKDNLTLCRCARTFYCLSHLIMNPSLWWRNICTMWGRREELEKKRTECLSQSVAAQSSERSHD